MSNHDISADGDRAIARTYVDAWIMSADNASEISAIVTWHDELVRTNDGWRIARRRFTPVCVTASTT
jgi:hypothetical protein